ncbi:DUF3265 domain-containing protein [Vibrio vulnificus]|nr:hypothetical protein VVMO6_01446 [Vibrio vulnificus MO6-24/O]EGR0040986.1 DUF3265 domain-containing protein [Vibrio vulnificus]EGR0093685.1 DUF3265 domain-containing protein [Vibrio vulnificus]EGR0098171.1 DUF3265 domain-containing protein [Vibrio vulnificus]EGR1425955.1 DUF3265 domain-containing protein [Vibrio vulnificus]
MESNLTKRLRQIRNAWHFCFDSAYVFTAQWFRFSCGVAHYLTRRYVFTGK